jgi:protein-disulfide isomerase
VTGTPSFKLNGELLIGTFEWKVLRTQLDARL